MDRTGVVGPVPELGIGRHRQGDAHGGEHRCCQYATELRKGHELNPTGPVYRPSNRVVTKTFKLKIGVCNSTMKVESDTQCQQHNDGDPNSEHCKDDGVILKPIPPLYAHYARPREIAEATIAAASLGGVPWFSRIGAAQSRVGDDCFSSTGFVDLLSGGCTLLRTRRLGLASTGYFRQRRTIYRTDNRFTSDR